MMMKKEAWSQEGLTRLMTAMYLQTVDELRALYACPQTDRVKQAIAREETWLMEDWWGQLTDPKDLIKRLRSAAALEKTATRRHAI